MDFIILAIVAVVVAFYAGWKVHEMFIIHIIQTDPDIIEEACRIARKDGTADASKLVIRTEDDQTQVTITTDEGKTITAQGVELMIEQVNGVLYAYAKANGQFVAQASTLEDLMSEAHKRFPGKTFFGNMPEEHQNS